jgi:flagellar hook assembly protein FlgD
MWIPYQLVENVSVTIRIFDQKGKIIRTLDFGNQQAGSYMTKGKAAYWDGKNEYGECVSSGVYFYQLKAGKFSAVRRMTIIK